MKKDIEKAVKSTDYSLPFTDIEVTRTTDAKFGDFSTNVALRLRSGLRLRGPSDSRRSSTTIKQLPQETAKILTDSLRKQPYIQKLEVAGPGFINFFIKPGVWQKEVSSVLKTGDKFGSNSSGKGKKARVEFVSANPTGPLHFGNARGGPIGDALASILEFSGYKVVREYLHNDIGGQVDKLGESVLNVQKGAKLEDQEYKGEYVRELAKKIKAKDTKEAGKAAVDLLFAEIKEDCAKMGISFDEYYPESEFISSGQTKLGIDHLREKGFIKEKDGALWFAPSDEFLKDWETVVKKSDGNYTYFANDIAYHDLKFKDNPDLVIDVFGANHHGHVPRLQAVVKALGYDVSKFHVILYQWVRFKRGGELVKMSKRSGTFVTAREVLDEVGRDALRFFILMHDPNSHIDFDLELAKQKSKENPVYYVQYAHARICSILVKTNDERPTTKAEKTVDYSLLTTVFELELIKQISRLPELVEDITSSFAVHQLTTYATKLANSFHRFYENCPVLLVTQPDGPVKGRVVGEKKDLMEARIGLIMATKIALESTLNLLGISAPEKM